MAQVNVMWWNLGDLNNTRAAATGLAYIQYLAAVVQYANVGLLGLSGIKSNLGGRLGELMVSELNNRTRSSGTSWNYIASPPLGMGRDEQYLVIWNLSALNAYKPTGQDYWVWNYPLPSGQFGSYGFPGGGFSADMPPFTMFFSLPGSQKFMPFVLWHAPEWNATPTPGQNIQRALINIAQIPVFDLGQGSLIMGTFNVPMDDNVNSLGSNGATAFGTLAGTNGKYTQLLTGARSQLSDNPLVAMTIEDALAQTCDNFFFRRNGTTNGINGINAMLPDLFQASMGSIDENNDWVPAPLGPALAQIEATVVGMENVTSDSDGSYVTLDDCFTVYRTYVSSNLPLLVTITY